MTRTSLNTRKINKTNLLVFHEVLVDIDQLNKVIKSFAKYLKILLFFQI